MKVLLVDDSNVSKKITKNYLSELNFEFIEANNGEEGIKQFAKNPDIKLIITDLEMPKIRGDEMLKYIFKIKKIDTIVLTSTRDQSETLTLNQERITVLNKPVSKEDLIKAINKIKEKNGK